MKRALLIGINYRNSNAQLNGCINDIKNIREILINNCNYNIDNIELRGNYFGYDLLNCII